MITLPYNPETAVAFSNRERVYQTQGPASSSAVFSPALLRPVACASDKHWILLPGDGSQIKMKIKISHSGEKEPCWVKPTLAAFEDIQNLAPNWDSYGAQTISPDRIIEALGFLSKVMRQDSPSPSVVPLSDGGLQLEWHRRQRDLEITFPAAEPPSYFFRNRSSADPTEIEAPLSDLTQLSSLVAQLV